MNGRILTRGLAALGLATSALVGLGAAAAHADEPVFCSQPYYSDYGARYTVCLRYVAWDRAYATWAVDPTFASTDERFYLRLASGCGDVYDINWNDKNDQVWDFTYSPTFTCTAGDLTFEAILRPQETGHWSGPEADAG
ncbi:hypothetical protein [Streptomyces sp. NPDC001135]